MFYIYLFAAVAGCLFVGVSMAGIGSGDSDGDGDGGDNAHALGDGQSDGQSGGQSGSQNPGGARASHRVEAILADECSPL